jgi:mono/diheme cytochrome c family protein
MKAKVIAPILAIGIALAFVMPALAADNDIADGQKYFVRYCASCHGTDGGGDGPVAKTLVTAPANLRKLGDKYGMPLPAHKIADFIDGRDSPRAHGSHEMPVWGEKLYETGAGERGEYGIGEVLGKIIAYLNTIQDRRTAMR